LGQLTCDLEKLISELAVYAIYIAISEVDFAIFKNLEGYKG